MMHRSSKFRRNEKAQMITLAGVIIALTVVLLAIVVNTAAISGQKTVMQEVDDAHYVFKNVRDVYGDVLRRVSNNGSASPFNPNLTAAELNMTRILGAHGYSTVFEHRDVDLHAIPPNAVALIIFSDKDMVYRDDVMYDLSTGDIIVRRPLLRFVEDSVELDKKNKIVSFNVTNVAPHDVTIDEMNVSWDPSTSTEKLRDIWIGTEVWKNVKTKSGEIVDLIPDATIASGETVPITLVFNKDMTDKTFIVEFIYTDGFSDSITFET